MKRAVAMPGYSNTQTLVAPAGIVRAVIDPETGQLATPSCPTTREEVFVAGTEPTVYCQKHGGQTAGTSWLERLFGKSEPPPPVSVPSGQPPQSPNAEKQSTSASPGPGQPTPAEEEKKRGVLGKIFGIFGGGKKPQDTSKPKPPQP
jgi:hypothetical protein